MFKMKHALFMLITALSLTFMTACQETGAGGLLSLLQNDKLHVVAYTPTYLGKWSKDNANTQGAVQYCLRSNDPNIKSMALLVRSLGLLKDQEITPEEKKKAEQSTEPAEESTEPKVSKLTAPG